MIRACSEDLVLSLRQAEIILREDSVEGLVHDGRATHPNSLNLASSVLSNLPTDEVLVPSFRVDVLA